MPDPQPTSAGPPIARPGLRLADLVGLVVGYGLASLLARSAWPGFAGVSGPPVVAFALEFGWLGLAMSGPVLLVLGRLGSGSGPRGPVPPRRPPRLGRPIGAVPVGDRWATTTPAPVVDPHAGSVPGRPDWTRAEWAWVVIGSYWITLTLLLSCLRAEIPGAVIGLAPLLVLLGMVAMIWAGANRQGPPPTRRWTQAAASGLLWTWPIAWVLLVLLGRTL